MSEIFEQVNLNAEVAHLEEVRRKHIARQHRQADRRLIRVLIGVLAVWVLMVVLSACSQISTGLAEFVASWAGAFLAIWFGAWLQFRFCRKGLMK
jgi:hypothetical protein